MFASEPLQMVFGTIDGSLYEIAAQSLKMRFTDNQLLVSNSDKSATFSLPELEKMYFSKNSSGVDGVINLDNEPVDVYLPSGALIGKYESASQAASQLPAGTYLIKTKSTTIKIAVK